MTILISMKIKSRIENKKLKISPCPMHPTPTTSVSRHTIRTPATLLSTSTPTTHSTHPTPSLQLQPPPRPRPPAALEAALLRPPLRPGGHPPPPPAVLAAATVQVHLLHQVDTEDHLPRRQEDRVLRTLRLLKNKTQQKQIIIKFSFQKTISKSIYQRTILKLKFLKTTSKLKPQILESFLCNPKVGSEDHPSEPQYSHPLLCSRVWLHS